MLVLSHASGEVLFASYEGAESSVTADRDGVTVYGIDRAALLAALKEHFGLVELAEPKEEQDICGLCGLPGADKFPHPEHWPGERLPGSELVHAECESAETARAHAALSNAELADAQRTP